MTGDISDETCAVKSAKSAKAADWIIPDAFEACAKRCLKEGSTAVFVTEDNKVRKLDASSSAKALPHLGHRVKVTDTATEGTLKVDTIAMIAMKPNTAANLRTTITRTARLGVDWQSNWISRTFGAAVLEIVCGLPRQHASPQAFEARKA